MMIDFLLEAVRLKDSDRTGWELREVSDPESIADHSWGAALLCMLFAEEESVDRDKAVRMALIHDLAEVEVGDIANRVEEEKQNPRVEDKEELEREAMQSFAAYIGDERGEEILSLWEEHNKKESKIANFVEDMDKVEMVLQALKYEKEERYDPSEDNPNFDEFDNMDEFFVSARKKITTETGKRLFRKIKDRYERVRG